MGSLGFDLCPISRLYQKLSSRTPTPCICATPTIRGLSSTGRFRAWRAIGSLV